MGLNNRGNKAETCIDEEEKMRRRFGNVACDERQRHLEDYEGCRDVEAHLLESRLEDMVDERFGTTEQDEGVVAGRRENVFQHHLVDATLAMGPVFRSLREYEMVAEALGSDELLQLLQLGTEEDVGFGFVGVDDVEFCRGVERVVDDAAEDLEDGGDA